MPTNGYVAFDLGAESGRAMLATLQGEGPDQRIELQEGHRFANNAIMQLPERDQTVITLRFFAELPYEDIGKILGISTGAARTATSRALVKIKDKMERLG